MGGSSTKVMSYEEAKKRFTPHEVFVITSGFERMCSIMNSPTSTPYVTIPISIFRNYTFVDFTDMPPILIERLFRVLDSDCTGTLNVQQFLSGLCILARGTSEERIKFLCYLYDVRNCGRILRNHMIQFAKILNDDNRTSKSESLASYAMIKELFTSSDGRIPKPDCSYDSFRKIAIKFINSTIISWVFLLGPSLLKRAIVIEDENVYRKKHTNKNNTDVKTSNKAMSRGMAVTLKEAVDMKAMYVEPYVENLFAGQEWNVISLDWFAQWCTYSGYSINPEVYKSNIIKTEMPGPIDNESLIVPNTVKLRRDVYYNHDFILLNKQCWDLLYGIYGGGPVISRYVINDNNPESNNELELFPLHITAMMFDESCNDVSVYGSMDECNLILSKLTTLYELQIQACDELIQKDYVASLLDSNTAIETPILSSSNASRSSLLSQAQNALHDLKIKHTTSSDQVQKPLPKVPLEEKPNTSKEDTEFVSKHIRLWRLHDGTSNSIHSNYKLSKSHRHHRSFSSFKAPNIALQRLIQLDETVEDANLADGEHIIVEKISSSGAWPLDAIIEKREASRSIVSSSSSSASSSSDSDAETSPDKVKPPNVRHQKDDSKHKNKKVAGLVGLYNLGNTCFLNASVQCLLHTRLLTEYFRCGCYLNDINDEEANVDGAKGKLAHAFGALIRDMWGINDDNLPQYNSVAPRQFKKVCGMVNRKFISYEQHDAQEFLASLLDGLASDLNRIKVKQYSELPDSGDRPDSEVSQEWWLNHLNREMSIVTALFTGQYKSATRCHTCENESSRFEPYIFLTLPLPESDYRYINLTFMYADVDIKPISCSVRVLKDGTFSDLKVELCKLLNDKDSKLSYSKNNEVPVTIEFPDEQRIMLRPEQIVFCNIAFRRRYIFNTMDEEKVLAQHREFDPLFAYQCLDVKSLTHPDKDESVVAVSNGASSDSTSPSPELASGTLVCITPLSHSSVGLSESAQQEQQAPPIASTLALIRSVSSEQTGTDLFHSVDHSTSDTTTVLLSNSNSALNKMLNSSSETQGNAPKKYYDVEYLGSKKIDKMISSTRIKLAPLSSRYIFLVQRQWKQLSTNYFLNPYRCFLSGIPFVFKFEPGKTTGRELYATVVTRLGLELENDVVLKYGDVSQIRFSDLNNSREDSNSDGNKYLIRKAWGFELRRVTKQGNTCDVCSWIKTCSGCTILPDDKAVNIWNTPGETSLAVDFGLCTTDYIAETQKAINLHDTYVHTSIKQAVDEDEKSVELTECLSSFTHEEILRGNDQVYCSSCQTFQNSTKIINIWRFPPVLVIHLKRFQHTTYSRKKLSNLVHFPLVDFDLSDFRSKENKTEQAASSNPTSDALSEFSESIGFKPYGGEDNGGYKPIFDLYGVVNHTGNLGAGHYYSYIHNHSDSKWYCYDDSRVTAVADESKIVTSNAYVLFYRRKDVSDVELGAVFPFTPITPQQIQEYLDSQPNINVSGVEDKCVLS